MSCEYFSALLLSSFLSPFFVFYLLIYWICFFFNWWFQPKDRGWQFCVWHPDHVSCVRVCVFCRFDDLDTQWLPHVNWPYVTTSWTVEALKRSCHSRLWGNEDEAASESIPQTEDEEGKMKLGRWLYVFNILKKVEQIQQVECCGCWMLEKNLTALLFFYHVIRVYVLYFSNIHLNVHTFKGDCLVFHSWKTSWIPWIWCCEQFEGIIMKISMGSYLGK